MKIRPLGNRLLVKPLKEGETTKSHYEVGENDKPLFQGVVISVGLGVSEEVKVGETVVYEQFSGNEIGEYLLLAEHDLAGVIEKENEND